MVYAIAALFVFQLLGEVLVQWAGLPLPGPLAGMLLLFAALILHGRVPEQLGRTTATLLQHMMLLFIPAIAGVVLHFNRVAEEWLPFLVACVVGAAVTLVVTALTLHWLLKRKSGAA
ncbi:MAG: CidA/LrgA family protein [Pseudomonadota bacterium]